MTEPNLFSAQEAADIGIKKATDSANSKVKDWAKKADLFLENYIKYRKEFMTEDVRNASVGTVPEPPSNRSWGGVIKRAIGKNLIYRKGYQNTTNSKAHGTPATLWAVRKNSHEETGNSMGI